MKKILIISAVLIIGLMTVFYFLSNSVTANTIKKDTSSKLAQKISSDERTKKIFTQESLMKNGRNLIKQGRYDEAIVKFKEAMNPALLLHDYDIDPPTRFMSDALKFQTNYDEALYNITKTLDKYPDSKEGNWHDQKLELEALIEARNTNSSQPVYNFIKSYKAKYKNVLPPSEWTPISDSKISTILRLYDTIGDYDAGIIYIDICLESAKNRKKDRGEDYTVYDRIKTSREASECAGLNIRPVSKRNPEWRACKIIGEYLKVREAFEREKVNGGPTCGKWGKVKNPKPGQSDYCIGDATQALIESNYFPW